jgi:hypothetical protein
LFSPFLLQVVKTRRIFEPLVGQPTHNKQLTSSQNHFEPILLRVTCRRSNSNQNRRLPCGVTGRRSTSSQVGTQAIMSMYAYNSRNRGCAPTTSQSVQQGSSSMGQLNIQPALSCLEQCRPPCEAPLLFLHSEEDPERRRVIRQQGWGPCLPIRNRRDPTLRSTWPPSPNVRRSQPHSYLEQHGIPDHQSDPDERRWKAHCHPRCHVSSITQRTPGLCIPAV